MEIRQQLNGLRHISLTPKRTARRSRRKLGLRLPVRTASDPETQPILTLMPPLQLSRSRSPGKPESSPQRRSLFRSSMKPIRATEGTMYANAHLGEPCTFDALDHMLSCSHKVHTSEAEPCGTNCHVRQHIDYAQPRDLDKTFVCAACIVEHIELRQADRYALFKAELEAVASEHERPEEWVDEKLELMVTVWQDEDIEEMKMLISKRKLTAPFWLEPQYDQLVAVAMKEKRLGRVSSRSTLNVSRAPSPEPSIGAISDSRLEAKMPQVARSFQGFLSRHSRSSSYATTASSEPPARSSEETRPTSRGTSASQERQPLSWFNTEKSSEKSKRDSKDPMAYGWLPEVQRYMWRRAAENYNSGTAPEFM